jgi:hypothetical protein
MGGVGAAGAKGGTDGVTTAGASGNAGGSGGVGGQADGASGTGGDNGDAGVDRDAAAGDGDPDTSDATHLADAGKPATCPVPIVLNYQEPFAGNGAAAPTCVIDSQHRARMTFQLSCADRREADAGLGQQYAICTFAPDENLDQFDPDRGGTGVLALTYCVVGEVHGQINLWYGNSSGIRRYLTIIPQRETMTTGCRTIFWSPADSCYSLTRCGRTDCVQSESSIADAGTDIVSGGGADAPSKDAGSDGDGATDADASAVPAICPSFQHSRVQLVAEWCYEDTSGTVEIERLDYYPAGCQCSGNEDCQLGQFCAHYGWPSGSVCGADGGNCPGVCASQT